MGEGETSGNCGRKGDLGKSVETGKEHEATEETGKNNEEKEIQDHGKNEIWIDSGRRRNIYRQWEKENR